MVSVRWLVAALAAVCVSPMSSVWAESSSGLFIVKCPQSHRAQVDPIVNPGGVSAHLHDFYGNRSTGALSSYASMTGAGTTCTAVSDTAAYWAPTLINASGVAVKALTAFGYYRNRPVNYGQTVPFPPDLRVIAGGEGTGLDVSWWNCFNDDSETVKLPAPPLCTGSGNYLVGHVLFPNCWDGVSTDSADHRSHVVHPAGTGPNACPSSHPVKVPQLRFFQRYPVGSGGPGWVLSDGSTRIHADFWNTWQQPRLEQFVRDCLNLGVNCGQVTG